MLTHDTIRDAAMLDTDQLARILTDSQLLDTPPGDAILGYLAGMESERYSALIVALASRGHVVESTPLQLREAS